MRVSAIADIHVKGPGDVPRAKEVLGRAAEGAEVLILAGDLTDHGRLSQAEALAEALHEVDAPVVAVLGNHDHESGSAKELVHMLESVGVHCLERTSVVIEGVGFAGAKGFGGGFGDRIIRGFGEDSLKSFVTESVTAAEGLRRALRGLPTQRRVAVTHYAPVEATIQGEPIEIHPFLGASRLANALDEGHADVAVHGHAHRGTLAGRTPGGIPVWNVSLPVLHAAGHDAFRFTI